MLIGGNPPPLLKGWVMCIRPTSDRSPKVAFTGYYPHEREGQSFRQKFRHRQHIQLCKRT